MNKRTKNLSIILMSFMILGLLMGCTNNSEKASTGETSVEKSEDFKIVVTDHLGRTVELPKAAEKIVGTHNPSMNMAVVVDGGGTKIAGFGKKDKAFGLYDEIAPEINDVTQIGKGKEINMETVLTVKPDLVLLPVRFKDQIQQFTDIGVSCIALEVEKFDSIKDALTIVGQALGNEERAEEIISLFDQKINKITNLAEQVADKPSVIMLSGSSKTQVSTDAMLQNQIIKTAGGTNVTEGFQSDELWTEVNIEQIIKWNPEIIYIPSYADYTVEDILNDSEWSNISAVQNKKVYVFPSSLEPWDYPTASASLGLCWAFNNMHPDLYSNNDLITDVDEYYQSVYGTTFSAEKLGLN
ncbi:ABC transporter substrate-binding protein [Alkalibaculum sporogenes]|nr:ABC transporter substrate-binding protein [Alkalibaculum sporogenes]